MPTSILPIKNLECQSLLKQLQVELIRNNLDIKTTAARRWLMSRVEELRKRANPTKIMKQNQDILVNPTTFWTGKMYMFFYDPKTKEKLSFYDRFPLVIPIEKYSDGFLGVNLHYLPLKFRAALLDNLMVLANSKTLDDRTRMRLSYQVLNSAARYKYFRPALKRYLFNQIQSRLLPINGNQWGLAIFLPVEQFKKATLAEVHRDSLEQLGLK